MARLHKRFLLIITLVVTTLNFIHYKLYYAGNDEEYGMNKVRDLKSMTGTKEENNEILNGANDKNSGKEANKIPPSTSTDGKKTSTLPPATVKYVDRSNCFLKRFCFDNLIHQPYLPLFCDKKVRSNLIVMVHSKAVDDTKRSLIRGTWADNSLFDGVTLRLLFIIEDMPENSHLKIKMETEHGIWNDILMSSDFTDDPKYATVRTLFGLQWLITRCAPPLFLLKTDDNMFINTFAFLQKLKILEKEGKTTNLLAGHLMKDVPVRRTGPLGVSKEAMPNDTWPFYLNGLGYLMTMDVATKIFTQATAITIKPNTFINLEDAFLTGVIPKGLNITPTHLNNMFVMNTAPYQAKRPRGMSKDGWKRYLEQHIFWYLSDKQSSGRIVNREEDAVNLWTDIFDFNINTYLKRT